MIDIVLISGKQGSGKTTTSEQLIIEARRSGKYYFIFKMKFADPLYEIHDMILSRMEFYSGKQRIAKNGQLLQYLGTEFSRNTYGQDVWVNALKKNIETKAKEFQPSKTLIIVDDCRFENEFDAFPDALKVRLEASEEVRKPRTDSWREDVKHQSETGLDKYANDNKFNLTIYTDTKISTPTHCATLILAQLLKRGWICKREVYK